MIMSPNIRKNPVAPEQLALRLGRGEAVGSPAARTPRQAPFPRPRGCKALRTPDSPLARSEDPETSHDAAGDVRPRRIPKFLVLLEVHSRYSLGLTDEEACDLARIATGGWKRCSELRGEGYLEVVRSQVDGRELKRVSRGGSEVRVSRVTDAGRAYLTGLRQRGRS